MKIQVRSAIHILSFSVLSLFFSSCQFVFRTALGIKMPEHESEAAQTAWLKRRDLSADNLYRLKREYADSNEYRTYNVRAPYDGDKADFSPIQFRFFSLKDNYSAGWATCLGSLKRTGILDTFPVRRPRGANPDLKLEPSLRMLQTNDGRDLSPEILKGYDYVLIAYWGDFLGVLSKSMLRKLEKYVDEHKDKKILYLKVNIADALVEEEGPEGQAASR